MEDWNDNLDYRGKRRYQTVNNDDPITIQSDAHLADVNRIMETFLKTGTGMLDDAALRYQDVSDFTDLGDALRQARDAEIEFMKLPSKVREVFDHDVATWLDSAHDQEKRDALVEAGFIKDEKSAVQGGGTGGSESPPEAETAGGSAGSAGGEEAMT